MYAAGCNDFITTFEKKKSVNGCSLFDLERETPSVKVANLWHEPLQLFFSRLNLFP